MDSIEKARIRQEHWHQEEYDIFAEQLRDAGKIESADLVKEVKELTAKSTDCLRKALNALGA